MSVFKFGGKETTVTKYNLNMILEAVEKNYLARDGTVSATGPLNMDNNKISKVIDPEENQDPATKNYVDTTVAGRLEKIDSKGEGNFIVSGENGSIIEQPLKLKTLLRTQRQLRSDVDALRVGSLCSDIRFIRGADFASGSKEAYLFPINLISIKRNGDYRC